MPNHFDKSHPTFFFNFYAFGVRYCRRCRCGREAAILVFLYYVVGYTTSFYSASEKPPLDRVKKGGINCII